MLTRRPEKPRSLLAVLRSLKPLQGSLPGVRDRAPERVKQLSRKGSRHSKRKAVRSASGASMGVGIDEDQ